jgi:hypothetical protein
MKPEFVPRRVFKERPVLEENHVKIINERGCVRFSYNPSVVIDDGLLQALPCAFIVVGAAIDHLPPFLRTRVEDQVKDSTFVA